MITLSQHAQDAVALRSIDLKWIEATIESPALSYIDPVRLDRTHSFKAIGEFGGRVLHVVHRPAGPDVLVITVYFDRSAKL